MALTDNEIHSYTKVRIRYEPVMNRKEYYYEYYYLYAVI